MNATSPVPPDANPAPASAATPASAAAPASAATPATPRTAVIRAWTLVGVQALLFAAVVVAAVLPAWGPAVPSSLVLSLVIVLMGAVLLLVAGRRLGASLTPSPLPNGRGLVGSGPYRWVRHPIYTAVILACLGVAVGAGNLQTYAVVAALVVFFAFKARLEERHLVATYDGYAHYARRVGRFVPGVGRIR